METFSVSIFLLVKCYDHRSTWGITKWLIFFYLTSDESRNQKFDNESLQKTNQGRLFRTFIWLNFGIYIEVSRSTDIFFLFMDPMRGMRMNLLSLMLMDTRKLASINETLGVFVVNHPARNIRYSLRTRSVIEIGIARHNLQRLLPARMLSR